MAFTPAHVGGARGSQRQRKISPSDLIRVRKLYLEKRFKSCITACDELLQTSPSTPTSPTFLLGATTLQIHPVHEAFLLFHQAISYECLGIAAHKYSQNKISFLKSAKDKFEAAIDILPQPFATGDEGHYRTPRTSSPDLSRVDHVDDDDSHYSAHTPAPIRVVSETPSFDISEPARSPSEESFDSATSHTSLSATFNTPDFDKYSARCDPGSQVVTGNQDADGVDYLFKDLHFKLPTFDFESADFDSGSEEDDTNQQPGWLSRSMSCMNLAGVDLESDEEGSEEDDDPTISQTPAPDATTRLEPPMSTDSIHTSRLSASLSSQHVLCEDLVPSPLFSRLKKMSTVDFEGPLQPAPRPLPRTPSLHHTHLTLLPSRKTAVQTLISKFEGTLPSPNTPSSYTTATPAVTTVTHATFKTPVTPRFDMIRNAFDQEPNHTHLRAYLTSRSLASYNAHLSSFRAGLDTAIDYVDDLLKQAETIQQKHEQQKHSAALEDDTKGMPKNRLASLWLLGTPAQARGAGPRQKIDDSPTPASRVRASARLETLKNRKKLTPLRNRVDESEEKRAERIAKLRENGFKVYKESHGWKGEAYYEGFRRRVEIDLAA